MLLLELLTLKKDHESAGLIEVVVVALMSDA